VFVFVSGYVLVLVYVFVSVFGFVFVFVFGFGFGFVIGLVKVRHLDDGYGQDSERITQPVGVVRPRARVDDHSRRAWLG
jgi:hypothetical protein